MNADRYARIQQLLVGARELHDDDLDRYLTAECAGDQDLANEVRKLLAAGRKAQTDLFDERSIGEVRVQLDDLFVADDNDGALPEAIGPYRILRQIGRGGMGIVYEALQEEPHRYVALKVLRPNRLRDGLLQRFHQEAEVLALLQHPGVARIFDVGTFHSGSCESPYFAMEFVDGLPLREFATTHRLSVRGRVALMVRLCEAVQHAHDRGVIHRDLKPANVLVVGGTNNAEPRPVVLDFGIARYTANEPARQSDLTQTGQVLGTLAYMSPEQLDGSGSSIDQRIDIYALGVILYELLSGKLPLDLDSAPLAAVDRLIRDVEPPALGTVRADCRGDLENVCGMALRKERALRYASAAELGEDLQRYLDDQPVAARPHSTWYQAVKFARRNRSLVTSIAVTFAALVIGVAVAVPLALRAEHNERTAKTNMQNFEDKVSEFDQLAGVVKLERALERERDLFPAWPQTATALQQWLREDCNELLAMRPTMRATIQRVAPAPDRPKATTSARFLHGALSDLLEGLAGLEAKQKVEVERRLQWANGIRAWTTAHPLATVSWQTAAEQARTSTAYTETKIQLDPAQMLGLVPLGQNPATGLQEFYHLRSAWDGESDPATIAIPQHEADGSIKVGDDTGIVFALLPGGRTQIAGLTQTASEDGEIVLEPFLLARHELTQGQWQRLWTGATKRAKPSSYFAGGKVDQGEHYTNRNPVESVTWTECDQLMREHGLILPTIPQWQHGARGGATGEFFCPVEELHLYANLADKSYRIVANRAVVEDWDDGMCFHAPVGSLRPNRFGLYDVHGNVKEFVSPLTGAAALDTQERASENQYYQLGGGYGSRTKASALDYLDTTPANDRYSSSGVRAARQLTTSN